MSQVSTNTTNVNKLMENLLADLQEEISLPQPGTFVTGEVIGLKNKRIVLNLTPAAVGIISGREIVDGLNTAKQLTIGDKVRVFVLEEENANGYFVLSLRKAGREKAWQKLRKMQESGDVAEVVVQDANRGGLMTEFSGIRAFIPVSQLAPEHYPRVNGANVNEILSRLKKLIGKKLQVQAITVEENENKLILSERSAMSIAREQALAKLKIGQKIKGRVSGTTNFGIFLRFNEHLEGLVHLSELSRQHVNDPADFARLGEEKEAIVLDFDKNKISLSIRQLTPDPWPELTKDLKIEDLVTGKITKITNYGALVEIKKDLTGLLHFSEVPEKEMDNLQIGQTVKTKIIEKKEHRIALSLKALKQETKKEEIKLTTAKKTQAEKKEEDPIDSAKSQITKKPTAKSTSAATTKKPTASTKKKNPPAKKPKTAALTSPKPKTPAKKQNESNKPKKKSTAATKA